MRLIEYAAIHRAVDKAAFKRQLVDFAHEMDFALFNAVIVVEHADGDVEFKDVGSNRPASFVDGTSKELAKADPVMTQLRRQGLPFAYDQAFYVNAGAAELWETAAPFGYRTGISASLRLSGNRRFLIGLDREEPLPRNERHFARMLADFQLLAVHCQDAAERILMPTPIQIAPRLTARELETLKWTSEGKTAWETGMILGISERTANLHLQAASRKLNSMNKHQAVLRALRMGLIT